MVFHDWGVGSDRKGVTGGAFGEGLEKNVVDCYRFIVQNHDPGAQSVDFCRLKFVDCNVSARDRREA